MIGKLRFSSRLHLPLFLLDTVGNLKRCNWLNLLVVHLFQPLGCALDPYLDISLRSLGPALEPSAAPAGLLARLVGALARSVDRIRGGLNGKHGFCDSSHVCWSVVFI